MNKTILIPTDFSIESLNLVKYAAESATSERINILLTHGLRLSDSILDLLFFSRNQTISKLTNDDFNAACKILLNKYQTQVDSLSIDFFSGFTRSAFQNFLEAHKVHEILIPKSYVLNNTTTKSFDLLPFIKSSSYQVNEVQWQPIENVPEKGRLAEIFLL